MIELFPYQQEGAKWLAGRKTALLADQMGLGKTAQVIRACDLLGLNRILVVCPAVARVNWLREFEKFSTTSRPAVAVMGQRERIGDKSLVVCSYDLTLSTAISSQLLRSRRWGVLVLDECHYLKAPAAKRTRAVLGRDGLVRQADRVWALSGTPAPNHPAELWPLLYTFGLVSEGYDRFVERFCLSYETPYGKQITGARRERIPELRAILGRVMLRRKKEDVMTDLPPIWYQDVVVEPGPVDIDVEPSFVQWVFPTDRTAELHQQLDRERQLVETTIKTTGAGRDGLKALEALSSSVSTLRRYTGLQKVQATAEMIAAELEAGAYEKVVIFAIHQGVIEGLRSRLSKFKPVTLYGGTKPEKRQRNVDKFQRSPKCRVFIGNIQAAGTAITLTAAHNVVFIESDWVPGNNAQAAMRCHRIGQTKPVTCRFVGLSGSIDEKISQVLKRKTRDLTKIFDE